MNKALDNDDEDMLLDNIGESDLEDLMNDLSIEEQIENSDWKYK